MLFFIIRCTFIGSTVLMQLFGDTYFQNCKPISQTNVKRFIFRVWKKYALVLKCDGITEFFLLARRVNLFIICNSRNMLEWDKNPGFMQTDPRNQCRPHGPACETLSLLIFLLILWSLIFVKFNLQLKVVFPH